MIVNEYLFLKFVMPVIRILYIDCTLTLEVSIAKTKLWTLGSLSTVSSWMYAGERENVVISLTQTSLFPIGIQTLGHFTPE